METTQIFLVATGMVLLCFNQNIDGKSLVIYRHSIFDTKDDEGLEFVDEGKILCTFFYPTKNYFYKNYNSFKRNIKKIKINNHKYAKCWYYYKV